MQRLLRWSPLLLKRFRLNVSASSLYSAANLSSGERILAVELNRSNTQLIHFLQKELALSATAIAMALRHSEQDPGPLPMILWQYGFVSLEQLEQIFDWMEG